MRRNPRENPSCAPSASMPNTALAVRSGEPMTMSEGDLKHLDALASKRAHGSLMALPSDTEALNKVLADEVPGLIAEVRLLQLQLGAARKGAAEARRMLLEHGYKVTSAAVHVLDGIIAEKGTVRVGQIWQDWDIRSRSTGRRLKVIEIVGDRALVQHPSGLGAKTKIKLNRFKPTSTGYKLIQDVT